VWKHPNCRVGYIAQHAFHHIEKHLDETANDYIRWRYANGGDREATVKVTSICTAEEIKKQEAKFEVPFPQEDGTITKSKLTVERFTERRKEEKKDKKTYYECVFTTITGNHWVERDLLCKNGWEKVLNLMDERIALRATQFQRPLTKENVQKHIKDVGLDPEFSTHMRMGLSRVARRSRSSLPRPCGLSRTCSSSTSPPTTSTASPWALWPVPSAPLRVASS
jgi:elongation factor 3